MTPAKIQGELMSYRKGYTTGRAEGKRLGMELAAKMCEGTELAKSIREAVPKRRGNVRGKQAWG